MDWKKEKISTAELERRQKEYMNEALAMMKRSGSPPKPAFIAADEREPEAVTEQPVTEQADAAASAETETGSDSELAEAETEDEGKEETEQEAAEPEEPGSAGHAENTPGADESFGVYTADELKNSEYKSEGLKKAAEILEEMTKSTEMMKKLAEGDESSSSDTTDFPDFSSYAGEGESGDCFREAEEAGDSASAELSAQNE